jgi:hypothetical protein
MIGFFASGFGSTAEEACTGEVIGGKAKFI